MLIKSRGGYKLDFSATTIQAQFHSSSLKSILADKDALV